MKRRRSLHRPKDKLMTTQVFRGEKPGNKYTIWTAPFPCTVVRIAWDIRAHSITPLQQPAGQPCLWAYGMEKNGEDLDLNGNAWSGVGGDQLDSGSEAAFWASGVITPVWWEDYGWVVDPLDPTAPRQYWTTDGHSIGKASGTTSAKRKMQQGDKIVMLTEGITGQVSVGYSTLTIWVEF